METKNKPMLHDFVDLGPQLPAVRRQCGQVALHSLSPSTSGPHKLIEVCHLPIPSMAGHVVLAVPLLGSDGRE